jgi:hypothetical protein
MYSPLGPTDGDPGTGGSPQGSTKSSDPVRTRKVQEEPELHNKNRQLDRTTEVQREPESQNSNRQINPAAPSRPEDDSQRQLSHVGQSFTSVPNLEEHRASPSIEHQAQEAIAYHRLSGLGERSARQNKLAARQNEQGQQEQGSTRQASGNREPGHAGPSTDVLQAPTNLPNQTPKPKRTPEWLREFGNWIKRKSRPKDDFLSNRTGIMASVPPSSVCETLRKMSNGGADTAAAGNKSKTKAADNTTATDNEDTTEETKMITWLDASEHVTETSNDNANTEPPEEQLHETEPYQLIFESLSPLPAPLAPLAPLDTIIQTRHAENDNEVVDEHCNEDSNEHVSENTVVINMVTTNDEDEGAAPARAPAQAPARNEQLSKRRKFRRALQKIKDQFT